LIKKGFVNVKALSFKVVPVISPYTAILLKKLIININFLIIIIKYAKSVFPDVVRDNVVEGVFGYLQHVRAFEEECLFKSMVMRPCVVSCVGPPL
jgi:hypothetical protein